MIHNGIWGTVCDHYFDNNDAGVACRMLGYGYFMFISGILRSRSRSVLPWSLSVFAPDSTRELPRGATQTSSWIKRKDSREIDERGRES